VTGVAVEMPMVSRLVLVPKEYGFLVFEFVTLESVRQNHSLVSVDRVGRHQYKAKLAST
jgi:hypothetical protein